MTDFLIVGRGLAATTLAHVFHTRGLSFVIVGKEDLSTCSRVAAGIWNPVVFKRMTRSWLAEELVSELISFYRDCEQKTGKEFLTEREIIKPFTEEQEKALWLKKAAGELKDFIDKTIYSEADQDLAQLKIPNGYSVVKNSGNLDVRHFLEASVNFFKEQIVDDVFTHNDLKIHGGHITYRSMEAKNIIFCEGFLVKDNPFFSWIPLKPAKGQILTLTIPDLELQKNIFNRNGFLMRLSGNAFKLGATYSWEDMSQEPTPKGSGELLDKLKQMTDASYTVQKQEAGIRPSSLDRRPIIGPHPLYANTYVFNGLGTKGVMLAPFFAKNFVNFYFKTEPLHPEADINRFYHLYGKKN